MHLLDFFFKQLLSLFFFKYKLQPFFSIKRPATHNFTDIHFCLDLRIYQVLNNKASQVEVPDRKSICPDHPRRKVSMSRPSQTESAYVQTIVRSKFFVRSSCVQKSRLSCVPMENSCAQKMIICAFMSRISSVQKALCPDFLAYKNAYVQTFVRSKRKFVRSKIDNLCIHVQTIVRSKGLMSRLSCVQKCLCPDFLSVQKLTMSTKIDDLISPKKTSPKWFGQSNFLNSSPIMAKVEHTQQK